MARIDTGTWVLVADSEKALFLENIADAENPHLVVRREEHQSNPSDLEQSANRPGRMYDGGPGQRSALDDTDWHELAKERFASDLADILYRRAHRGEFDKIVLACAPQVLGNLRPELHKEVTDRVVGEVPKLLTNHQLDDIEKIVKHDLEST
ncbi:host attachment family protein [Maritimibacter sp. DP1N21-5]|uniref:host attachment family protein n=1 Tax=Maritimibacter sp. DP1N21-5 TaxID=2836867 RepID=UPI001C4823E0|nr:host attachment family protein [Maritimibacter sp. DP1N21-5]MBV7410037.1 host attachment family protein [Maritimibacter sp. DP1N21-5]